MGRTARGTKGKGKALLFLLPEEIGFLRYLRKAKVPLNEYEYPKSKISTCKASWRLIGKNYYLRQSAKAAYRSYHWPTTLTTSRTCTTCTPWTWPSRPEALVLPFLPR